MASGGHDPFQLKRPTREERHAAFKAAVLAREKAERLAESRRRVESGARKVKTIRILDGPTGDVLVVLEGKDAQNFFRFSPLAQLLARENPQEVVIPTDFRAADQLPFFLHWIYNQPMGYATGKRIEYKEGFDERLQREVLGYFGCDAKDQVEFIQAFKDYDPGRWENTRFRRHGDNLIVDSELTLTELTERYVPEIKAALYRQERGIGPQASRMAYLANKLPKAKAKIEELREAVDELERKAVGEQRSANRRGTRRATLGALHRHEETTLALKAKKETLAGAVAAYRKDKLEYKAFVDAEAAAREARVVELAVRQGAWGNRAREGPQWDALLEMARRAIRAGEVIAAANRAQARRPMWGNMRGNNDGLDGPPDPRFDFLMNAENDFLEKRWAKVRRGAKDLPAAPPRVLNWEWEDDALLEKVVREHAKDYHAAMRGQDRWEGEGNLRGRVAAGEAAVAAAAFPLPKRLAEFFEAVIERKVAAERGGAGAKAAVEPPTPWGPRPRNSKTKKSRSKLHAIMAEMGRPGMKWGNLA